MMSIFEPNLESKYLHELAETSRFLQDLETKLAKVGGDLEVEKPALHGEGFSIAFKAHKKNMIIAWSNENEEWLLDCPGLGVLDLPVLDGLSDTIYEYVRPATHEEVQDEAGAIRRAWESILED